MLDGKRVIITGADRSKRMVLMDSGDQAGHLADYGGSMGYGQTTWEVLSFETTTDTFEGLIQSGTMTAAQVAPMSTTSARVSRTIVASGSGE